MAITISTHNGSKVDLAHNRRENWRIESENKKWSEKHPGEIRIDISGKHEILLDNGSLKECYHKLFDSALNDFNERQMKAGHPDRVIKDYLNHIKTHEKDTRHSKHPIYEIIYTVGSKDKPIPAEIAERILKEMAAEFEKRNPNLFTVCQAFHADEAGVPHVHTSYIPVAYNMTRGMRTQNALKEALRQQGFIGDRYNTAQMMWEHRENNVLEEICKKHGYDVEHPQAGTAQAHMEYEEFRTSKILQEKQAQLTKIVTLPAGTVMIKKGRLEQLEEIEKEYQKDIPKIADAKRSLHAVTETMKTYYRKLDNLEKDKEHFDKKVNEAANRKIAIMQSKAFEFINHLGLWNKFVKFTEEIKDSISSRIGM